MYESLPDVKKPLAQRYAWTGPTGIRSRQSILDQLKTVLTHDFNQPFSAANVEPEARNCAAWEFETSRGDIELVRSAASAKQEFSHS